MSEIKHPRLRKEFAENIGRLVATAREFPWDDKTAYAWWLGQTYYFVRHTTRFLGLAASKCRLEQGKLHNYLVDHLKEEKGHDKLILNDLKALGWKIDQIPELPETSALYQSQYYFLEHTSEPVVHFGYSLCLEGLAATEGGAVANELARLHGENTTTFIRLHADADADHFEHGVEVFQDLTETEADLIIRNLRQSTHFYGLMLKRIKQETAVVAGGARKAA